MNKTTTISALAVMLSLGTAVAYAQGPAGQMPGRDGTNKRAERMLEHCERFEARLAEMDKNLSTDQVRDIIAGRLAEAGNPNLKVGKAAKKGDVVSVEIVTKDGSLVTSRELSTKTGLPPSATQRCDKLEERIEKAKANGTEFGQRDGRGERRNFRRGGERGDRALGLGLGIRGEERDLNLTSEQVKKLAEARLIMQGNPRLKVGDVKEKDKDTYTVNIVTVDNSLVLSRDIDKHTGRQLRN